MAKIICYSGGTRHALERGVGQLADTVKIAIGSKSRNVMLDEKFGVPLITNDGVTITKEIELDDPFENIGTQLMKEVSTKTNDVAGDGTTTVTLLAQAIIREGLKNLTVDANPIIMKKGIAKATTAAVEATKANSKKVSGSADIAHVGTISSSDEIMGKLIVEVTEKVSHNGVIIVEESKTTETYSKVVEDTQFGQGYVTPYVVTDTEKMGAVLDNALTLITGKEISNAQELLPILKQMVQSGKKLLVTAEGVEGEALSTPTVNKLRGTLNVVHVRAPGFSNHQKEMLEDIIVLTGGTVITSDMSYRLKEATMDILSHARQVKVPKESTIIMDDAGSVDAIKARVNQIKSQIGATIPDYDREKLQERLAKMVDGMAIIRVGTTTEMEIREKKLHVEDALSVTRATVKGGIVTGGSTVYVNVIASVEKLLAKTKGDERTSVPIIAKALTKPMRQIAINAGISDSVVLEDVKEVDKVGYGLDACSETYVDMISAGIVDPTKMTRSAPENTISIAITLLTTESPVADKPQPSVPVVPVAPDMGGMC